MEEKRKRTRVRRKNSGIKKLVFFLILLFIIIYLLVKVIVPGSVTLSRYVYSAIRNYYLTTREFYFNSDKLSLTTAQFESDNWSGVDDYEVKINMNSRKNMTEVTKVDIPYTIEYEYAAYRSNGIKYNEDKIDFSITDNQTSRAIPTFTADGSPDNQDAFAFTIKPKAGEVFENNDYVYVKITTKSTSPYVSTLVGEFKIIIGTLGKSYRIEDSEYDPYCELIITNTLDYYIVDEDIDGYAKDSTITIAEYLALSEENKEKCHSMLINLDFNPEELRLDTTSGVYLTADKTAGSPDLGYITTVDGFDYINHIMFKMEAEESKVIKFYKVDASKNYTYPNAEGTASAVSVVDS